MTKKCVMLARKQELTVSQLASLGGAARARALTAERRKEIATKAAKARWANRGRKLQQT